MTPLLDSPPRPAPGDALVATESAEASRPGRFGDALRRVARFLVDRRRDIAVLVPLLVLAGVVQGAGLFDAPARTSGEGVLVGRAWALLHPGEATQPLPTLDGSPLGPLAVAAWAGVTGAFDRAPTAVAAGRELVLLGTLVTAVLLWVLARRLRSPRWAAATAVVLATLSPLALELHRPVTPENLAAPWVLAAVVLVLGTRGRAAPLAAAAGCLLVGALTAESTLLVLPALSAVAWRRRPAGRHRTSVALGATLLAAVGVSYLAAVALGAGSGSRAVVAHWLDVDPVLVAAVLGATPLALLLRRVRAVAVGTLVLLGLLALAAYPPQALGVLLVAAGAILVPAVATSVHGNRPTRLAGREVGLAGGLLATGVAGVLVGAAASGWGPPLRLLMTAPQDTPMADATVWVAENVAGRDRLLVDDALWVEVLRQGRDPGTVAPLSAALDAAEGSAAAPPYAWVVSTAAVRDAAPTRPALAAVLTDAVPVASFGAGAALVEVLSLPAAAPDSPAPGGEDLDGGEVPEDRSVAVAAGQQLLANPAITTSEDAAGALISGGVDERMLLVLAILAADHDLTVSDFPGSDQCPADGPLCSVRITEVDGRPAVRGAPGVDRLVAVLGVQTARFRPTVSYVAGAGQPPAVDLTLGVSAP